MGLFWPTTTVGWNQLAERSWQVRLWAQLASTFASFPTLMSLLAFLLVYRLSPKSIRRKAYFARLNFILANWAMSYIVSLYSDVISIIDNTMMLKCFVFMYPDHCEEFMLSETLVSMREFSSYVIRFLGTFFLYSGIGLSLTTSFYLYRVQQSTSVDKVISLSRYRFFVVPWWEYLVGYGFGVLITVIRMFFTYSGYAVSEYNLWEDATFDVAETIRMVGILVRMPIMAVVVLIEVLLFLFVVHAMVKSRTAKALRLNYLTLIVSFIAIYPLIVLSMLSASLFIFGVIVANMQGWDEWQGLLMEDTGQHLYLAGMHLYNIQFILLSWLHIVIIIRTALKNRSAAKQKSKQLQANTVRWDDDEYNEDGSLRVDDVSSNVRV